MTYHRRRYRADVAAGLCPICRRRPSAPGRVRCAECSAAELARLAARTVAGRCAECSAELSADGSTRFLRCRVCRRGQADYANAMGHAKALRDARRAAGLCTICAEPVAGATLCAACSAERRESYHRNKQLQQRGGHG